MSNERRQAVRLLDEIELITGESVPGWSREAVLVAIEAGMLNNYLSDEEIKVVAHTIIAEEKSKEGPFFGL